MVLVALDCLPLVRTALASLVGHCQLDDPWQQMARKREQVVGAVRNCKSVANLLVGN